MHDPPSRRGFLRAALALGTAAAAGCAALPPSDQSGQSEQPTPTEESTPTEQTPTPEPTQTPTEEPSLPELGADFETDVSGDGIPDLLVEPIADEEGLDEINPYRKNVFVEVDY